MKIALTHTLFYPTIGGIETYLKNLVDEYIKMGHEVIILLPQPNADTVHHGYKIVSVPVFNFFGYQVPTLKTKKILQKENPDLVHVNSPLPYATVMGWYAKILKKKVISTYHADVNPQKKWIQVAAQFERKLYRKIFDNIIVTTQLYKDRVVSFYPKEKISVIPLGVDRMFLESGRKYVKKNLPLIENKTKSPFILFVGALDKNHYYKGVDTLLTSAAMKPLRNYVLVGDGDMKKTFIQKAKNLHLSNVKFFGKASFPALKKFYQEAFMLVLPSNSSSEGYGIVLLEAMACGTPIITTDQVGSHQEIEEAQAGIVIKANNPTLLKRTIEKILKNKLLRENIIKNGLKFIAERTWQQTALKTLKLYQKIVQDNPSPVE